MPQVQLNGTSLYYETHGSGVPIVFIHDHLSSHHVFGPQVEYFSKRVRVIVFDLRGYGRSGRMDIEVNRIIDTQCEDLKELLEKLGVPKAILVASSSGGILAQKFTAIYPGFVHALVLVDSDVKAIPAVKNKKIKSMVEALAWVTHYLPAEFFIRSLRVSYNKWLIAYHILRRELQHKRPTELIKQHIALSQIDILTCTKQIRVPVLCVTGAQNERRLRQVQQEMVNFPHAQKVVLQDAMYPTHLCQPHIFNRLVLDFIIDLHILHQKQCAEIS
ncbi:alpha/beta hydrolase [Paenibacillus polymyxa]|uniref:alpha/beta fold hydrolase n=1 Tax=Paenibacillus polymyxa TaxID=1406 RepID=UPI001BE6A252|nr:alpha/beta hydrolase [Paenibacillus polymyxa]MBT2282510.1 alpha/beta hydrolase [Paenibacillus polymyxa]